MVGGLVVALIIGAIVAGTSGDGDTQTASEGETTEPDPETTDRQTTTTDEPEVTTSTTAAPAGPTTVAMGQPVDVAIDEIEFDQDATYATVTLANPTTAEVEPGEFGVEPTNGLFLVVDAHVVVHPNSEGAYATSESDFNFVGGDGSVYEIGFATEFGPTLGSRARGADRGVR